MSLDAMLQGEPEPAANDDVVENAGGQAEETDSAEPTASTGENEGATPGAEAPQKLVPLPALQEERRKRQEIQARLEELERRVATQSAPPQPPQPKWEWTEDKVLNDLPGAFRTVEQRQQQFLDERFRAYRYDSSVMTARQMHQDYDDVMTHYQEVVKSQPHLMHTVDASPMPALTAYKAVKAHIEQQNANDPARIESLVQERVKAELAKMSGTIAAAGVPKSITSARGSGAASPSSAAWSGPPPMDEIFRRK